MQSQRDLHGAEAKPRRLPLLSKLGFGVGQGGEGIHTAGINTFLMLYYQQVLGLPASMAGIALMISMVVDAFGDPLAGAISDRIRSRWGRRHPMMALSVIPIALSFVALFSPPAGLDEQGLFLWLTTFAVLARLSLTLYHIPHLALGAEMASDYNDRSTVFSYASLFGWVMALGGAFAALSLFFPETPQYRPGTLNPAGYTQFAIAFAIVMALAMWLSIVGTLREIPHLPVAAQRPAPLRPGPFLNELGLIVRNRSFVMVFLGMLAGTLVVNVNEVLTPFMSLHFWGLPTDRARWLGLAVGAGLPVALGLTWVLPRLIDKRNTILACLFTFVLISNTPVVLRLLDVPWFPTNGDPSLLWVLLLTQFCVGCSAPVILIMLASVLADVCDEIELESGRRLEGLVFSARSLIVKLTSGAGNALGGFILDAIAFPAGAVAGSVAPEVLFRLGAIAGPIGGCFALLGSIFYLGYKLDARRHAQIAEALRVRRASGMSGVGVTEPPITADPSAAPVPAR
jgi:glycoside/pentoside/hexuronide:cation symporter, GPH family